jgi:citrate synthase
MIGKAGTAVTSISTADADSITVRDRDLTSDLMGRVSFTEYFYLLVTGREPTEDQRFFLDLLLVAIAEHGLVPTNQVARMTHAADPEFLQGAVAAGLLGCGSVILGTTQLCGDYLIKARERREREGLGAAEVAAFLVREARESGKRIPGFGHPVHKPKDPRAQRILELADERGIAGMHTEFARSIEASVNEIWPKPLPMNVSMMIAAVLLDLNFPAPVLKGIPILARTASLLAHLAEEAERPIGFLMAHHAEEAISYEPSGENR